MVKKIFLVLLLAAIGYAVYWFAIKKKQSHPEGPPPVPLALKKHSDPFNKSVDSLVNAYLDIKNALINADTAAAKTNTTRLIELTDHFPLDELKNDTAMVIASAKANLGDVKENAISLLKQPNITEVRRDFSSLTEQMLPFLRTINYEGPTLYFDNCPMAFNDSEGANWISNTEEIMNPYLGKNHPKYKATMLSCGDVKDSIKAK